MRTGKRVCAGKRACACNSVRACPCVSMNVNVMNARICRPLHAPRAITKQQKIKKHPQKQSRTHRTKSKTKGHVQKQTCRKRRSFCNEEEEEEEEEEERLRQNGRPC